MNAKEKCDAVTGKLETETKGDLESGSVEKKQEFKWEVRVAQSHTCSDWPDDHWRIPLPKELAFAIHEHCVSAIMEWLGKGNDEYKDKDSEKYKSTHSYVWRKLDYHYEISDSWIDPVQEVVLANHCYECRKQTPGLLEFIYNPEEELGGMPATSSMSARSAREPETNS